MLCPKKKDEKLQEIEHLTKVFQKVTKIINKAEKLEEFELVKAELIRWQFRSGAVVNYMDKPPIIGTGVIGEYCGPNKNRSGTIIANDEDFGSEIGVRWDDGRESNYLHCCKKGQKALLYE